MCKISTHISLLNYYRLTRADTLHCGANHSIGDRCSFDKRGATCHIDKCRSHERKPWIRVSRGSVHGQDTSEPKPSIGGIQEIRPFISCRCDMTEMMLKTPFGSWTRGILHGSVVRYRLVTQRKVCEHN